MQLVLVTVVTAATPLFLAALGELVAERSGVLNLGVEGMMVMGAATGFAAAYLTGSDAGRRPRRHRRRRPHGAAVRLLTVIFAVSQVAAGLALTIFGLGLSGLIGSGFVGLKREAAPHLFIPGLSDLPVVGRLVFGEDCFVYAGLILALAVSVVLRRTRAGLVLARRRRQSRLRPCARDAGSPRPPAGRRLRRGLCGPRRRLPVAQLHALLGRPR